MSLSQSQGSPPEDDRRRTPAWYWLRAHRLVGRKFKRQVPVGSYIVDFACLSRKLIVEVDGGQHPERPRDKDVMRG